MAFVVAAVGSVATHGGGGGGSGGRDGVAGEEMKG